MDGYTHCTYCGQWHAVGYECAALRRAREAEQAEQEEASARARYRCVECGRLIYLDDVAHGVYTPRGRALCLRCAEASPPAERSVTNE